VLNTLGAGFLEKANENGLAYEVCAAGLSAVQQCGAKVHYRDILVGKYLVDLLINDVLLVGLKTPCLLLNFGKPRLEIKRMATVICIANLANHRSPRLFSDALPVTHCFA
jgi:hypothetical protein